MGICGRPAAFAGYVLVLALIWSGGARAQDHVPAELPPADFTAPQYIDSRGCVFLRGEGGTWRPRLHDGSELVCGYPPSLSARRQSPDDAPRPFGPGVDEPSRAAQIERALSGQVFSDLRTGELAGQREPMQQRIDAGPEPDPDAPTVNLQAEIAAQIEVRRQMSDSLKPNRNLCRLLGYDASPPGAAQLGMDPTQGFCDGLSPNDLSRLALARPSGGGDAAQTAGSRAMVARPAERADASAAGEQPAGEPPPRHRSRPFRPHPLQPGLRRSHPPASPGRELPKRPRPGLPPPPA